ncbi:peptidase domain-containing ABC transporter [Sphingobacterium sp. JB170]|uniref:peptidase domain-containing ABC transporter n=1 Tax=Sphingobacterium sp. JB170 TaxID=1434842 RepID=UPI00097F1CBA|nr:peptidase domain-containing ABC transporter [Sphingobacterium sp. JB170]SJN49796.1 ABC transporter ATP-binding protein [Sphingobacterium sp. JB170]
MDISLPSSFPYYRQFDSMDCGPACLRMIAKYYGHKFAMHTLRKKVNIEREGGSLLGLCDAANSIGFRAMAAELSWDDLSSKIALPCIIHWNGNHFVVVYKISKTHVYIADPSKGKIKYSKSIFLHKWMMEDEKYIHSDTRGAALVLYPTAEIIEDDDDAQDISSMRSIFSYFLRYKRLLFQLLLGFLLASLIQLTLPFLTQSLVDVGIKGQDLSFIYLVLLAQIMLLCGQVLIDLTRAWVLLHISTRINLSIVSDFIRKLLKLPITYFETRQTGDILQRLKDHKRLEEFVTGNTVSVAFSLFTVVIFSIILSFYYIPIFITFVAFSLAYIGWVFFFLKYRRKIDIQRFEIQSINQGAMIELIQGVKEIKLTNSEKLKRWTWEDIQLKEFKLQIRGLTLTQYQEVGGTFINQGKNIVITFISALAVINGLISIGEMIAIQFIIGQLNSPIQQFIQFIQSFQDAKLSLHRLNEIQQEQDEENTTDHPVVQLPELGDITFKNVSFTYPGAGNSAILQNLNFKIPQGKTTAIVGSSGGGKTTICKLLLKYYTPTSGTITVGDIDFGTISHRKWRSYCSSVLQDSFIFSDTIENNIGIGCESIDTATVMTAAKLANIHEFIDALSLQYKTRIGDEGNGISQGQRQRILLARAFAKNPRFIFLDEATNALDANNEGQILDNLDHFLASRTALIVAHRLSTIRKADNIIVLKDGSVSEQGTHEELISLQGEYYQLVTKQLS